MADKNAMKNIKEAFGSNLREIRKSKNLTIESLSEKLEITPRQLAKIESGETFLTSETLCKISVVLDVSLKVLFGFFFLFESDYKNKFLFLVGKL